MTDNEYRFMREIIGSRTELAVLNLRDSNPRYKEVHEAQEKNWESIKSILSKLEREDHLAVTRYYEDEVHKSCFELDEAYLQGVKDCPRVLRFFNLIGTKQ